MPKVPYFSVGAECVFAIGAAGARLFSARLFNARCGMLGTRLHHSHMQGCDMQGK